MVVFGSFLLLSSLMNLQCLDSVSVHLYQGRRVCINNFYYTKSEQEIEKKREKKKLYYSISEGGKRTGEHRSEQVTDPRTDRLSPGVEEEI